MYPNQYIYLSIYLLKGLQWRHYYSPQGIPRPPPILHQWPAVEIGQVHQVISKEGYW